jgi:FKBP-type peptidyl-prolyl cis-trans isomerase 2
MRNSPHILLLVLLASTIPLLIKAFGRVPASALISRRSPMSAFPTCRLATSSAVEFTYELSPAPPSLLFSTGKLAAVMPAPPYTTAAGFFPGLFEALSDLPAGETKTVENIKLAASNPDMVITVPFSALEQGGLSVSDVSLGTELQLRGGLTAVITQIDTEKDMVTMDANPPLSRLAATTLTVTKLSESAPVLDADGGWATWGDPKYKTATFAGGCFWGLELMFQRVPGVLSTKVGYTQGQKADPTYEEVCSGSTGHTEAVQVVYDETTVR